ncbi:MAG: nucleoside triphosphate pyrophosphohydrolase [Clostridia bacterium]|nr:nucleoside triphosphate pyrophosphohydrolase [Clostridia bacterium]
MKTHNKLVRDKIPEIIKSNGESCKTRILDTNEYLAELNTKLKEELNEYLNAKDNSAAIEELADLEEVLRAVLDARGVSYDNFEEVRLKKVAKRGAFKDRIFLETTF